MSEWHVGTIMQILGAVLEAGCLSQPSQSGGGSSPTSSPCSQNTLKHTVPKAKNGELKLQWKEWIEKINFPFSSTGLGS